jgi:mRNA interferase RelE/StbE
MAYQVIVLPAADKVIARLPRGIRGRIAERLAALCDNPRPPGSTKLTDRDAYRLRVGDYRIIYTIHDDRLVVIVIDVGHRRDVYRRK